VRVRAAAGVGDDVRGERVARVIEVAAIVARKETTCLDSI
jgi:hypothetical protein